jgi:hypothetical protein
LESSTIARGLRVTVILGRNDFFGVPFPVVVADRFFHIYRANGRFAIDVFRWDESSRTASYEVQESKPIEKNITTNPTGIVTFASEAGGFLFKFRPKPGVSQIFGTIPAPEELEVHINDHEIRVSRGSVVIVTLVRNQFSGMPIGIWVRADHGISIGVSKLPAGMDLTRRVA